MIFSYERKEPDKVAPFLELIPLHFQIKSKQLASLMIRILNWDRQPITVSI